MSTRTVYEPTATMLEESKVLPFVVADYFSAEEMLEDDFEVRLASRKARHEAREASRVAPILVAIERIRHEGRTETFGHPTGYAYRLGQANRRLRNR